MTPIFRIKIILFLFFKITFVNAQVSINESGVPPTSSAMLDVSSLDKGMLLPRMNKGERDDIISPDHSLIIYQTDIDPGFYYNNGSPAAPQWIRLETNLSSLDHIGRIPIDTLPFVITTSGSYYLTKNLAANVGISIKASNVSIDLNGHTLLGLVGNASSALVTPTAQTNISISNGFIGLWGNEGINFSNASSCQFSNLMVYTNGLDGIFSGKNTSASNIITRNNGSDGIDVAETSVLSAIIAESNSNDGIEADHGVVIEGCTAKSNGLVGIKTTNLGTVSNCSAYMNLSHGFQIGLGTSLSYNSSSNNSGSGYYISASCLLNNNTAKSNTRHGFEILGNDNVFHQNGAHSNSLSGYYTNFDRNQFDSNISTINGVHGFDIQGSGCLVIKNSSSSNTTSAFNVTPANIMATAITSGTINTNTNPNANISF